MNAALRFPLWAVARHRLATDGAGVTTLVAAHGCPLRCKWCINPRGLEAATPVEAVDARALYERLRVDDLYFQATGGGVTFGGGEPLLHARFIREFRRLCQDKWRICAQTSLNIPEACARTAAKCVDEFIVDIKDMNPGIYRSYTGADNALVLRNLDALLRKVDPRRIRVRVPRIPGFNGEADVQASVRRLRAMGVECLEVFSYRVPEGAQRAQPGQPHAQAPALCQSAGGVPPAGKRAP